MAKVTIQLPSVLDTVTGGQRKVAVEAGTIREALDALFRQYPELRVHVFDESGRFRTHVLCFHNQTNTRWLEGLDGEVANGDTLTILQAVTGG